MVVVKVLAFIVSTDFYGNVSRWYKTNLIISVLYKTVGQMA